MLTTASVAWRTENCRNGRAGKGRRRGFSGELNDKTHKTSLSSLKTGHVPHSAKETNMQKHPRALKKHQHTGHFFSYVHPLHSSPHYYYWNVTLDFILYIMFVGPSTHIHATKRWRSSFCQISHKENLCYSQTTSPAEPFPRFTTVKIVKLQCPNLCNKFWTWNPPPLPKVPSTLEPHVVPLLQVPLA